MTSAYDPGVASAMTVAIAAAAALIRGQLVVLRTTIAITLVASFCCTLIEQDPHLGRCKSATSSMLQHGARLLKCDAGEDLGELADLDAVFEVLEECSHWNAGASENPCSAHPFRVTLHHFTSRPVNHG